MHHRPTEVNILSTRIHGDEMVLQSLLQFGENITKLCLDLNDLYKLHLLASEGETMGSLWEEFLVKLPRLRHLSIHGIRYEEDLELDFDLVIYNQLDFIPHNFAVSLTSLDLSYCHFASHNFTALRNFKNLLRLVLFNVKLFAPDTATLNVLQNLQKLRSETECVRTCD